MTKHHPTNQPDFSGIDLAELLFQRRQVAVVWSIEDVQAVRPDLNDDQAWKVLQQCRRNHDCEVGFNWELIKIVGDTLFPPQESVNEE